MTTPATDSHLSRPTLADVAALAGVSPATASRVLNGSAKVSGPARAGVHRAVSQLSYVRQRARAAAARPVSSLAVVVCEDAVRLFSDSFFSRMLIGAGEGLSTDAIQLVLLMVKGPGDHARVERYLARGLVDGVLLVSAHSGDPLSRSVSALGMPVVMAGRPAFPSDLPYVDADNRSGARAAVRHLIRSGRRLVTAIAGPQDMAVGQDRRAGYRDALAEANAAGAVVYGDFTQASGEHATARLLANHPDLDAIFAASDLMALGALRALRRAGRRVPDDVAVVGFDDAPLALHTDPRLTTVRQPVEQMGATMARELVRRVSGDPDTAPHIVFDTELVVRDSG